MAQTKEQRLEQLARGRATQQAKRDAAQAEETRPWSISGEQEEPFDDEEVVEKEEDEPPVIGEPPQGGVDIVLLRERLLQHLSPNERDLISDEDLLAIKAKQDKKAADERKKDVLERLEADMLHRARVEQGLLSANTLRTAEERARLAEKVMVKIEIPGAVLQQIPGFRVDGRLYENGREYEMTRAEFESLRESHYRIHINELRFAVLDQDKKAGITLNNRAQGTSAAHVLFAQAPVRLEAVNVE